MFAEHRDLVAQAILNGLDLPTIEQLIIDGASLDDEERAVLWLYAEALQADNAAAHLTAVSLSGLERESKGSSTAYTSRAAVSVIQRSDQAVNLVDY